MLSFIYTPVYWFILALEWVLRFAGWDAFVRLKSQTPMLVDNTIYEQSFWSIGRTKTYQCGSFEAWGPGLHAVLSPCERRHFWRFVWFTIVYLPRDILTAPVRLAGWAVDIERDAPGFGFFDTRLEGDRLTWEFWGFGMHVTAGNDRALKRRWAEARRQASEV